MCIVPILSDDLRGESNYFSFAAIKQQEHTGFPGSTRLSPHKAGQPNGRGTRLRTRRSQVQAPVAPPRPVISARNRAAKRAQEGFRGTKNLVTLLDLCVSSLRRGHANLLCIVPILSDDLRGESESSQRPCKRTQVTIPCIPVRRRRAGAWGSVEQAQAVSSSGALRLLLPPPGLPRLQWHRSPSRSLGVSRLGDRLYTGTRLVAGVASACQRALGTLQKTW